MEQADLFASLPAPPVALSTPDHPLTPEKKAIEREWRNQVRHIICEHRQHLSQEQVKNLSLQVQQNLKQHPFLQQKRRIASYMSFGGEIDTHALNDSLNQFHHIVLPVIAPEQKGIMHFYRYLGREQLVCNKLKILEPQPLKENYLAPSDMEVVLVPLVAFALNGARIGMGGGYYDRLLKKIHPNCLTIGLAYDFQKIESINIQSWDVPLKEIITPTHNYRIV